MITLLSESLALVLFELLRRLALHSLVAVRLRERNLHGPAEQWEAVQLVDGVQAGLLAIEDDKGLALTFDTALGDNIDDLAILLEDCPKNLLQEVDLRALIEIVDLSKLACAAECNVSCMLKAGTTHEDTATRLAGAPLQKSERYERFDWNPILGVDCAIGCTAASGDYALHFVSHCEGRVD